MSQPANSGFKEPSFIQWRKAVRRVSSVIMPHGRDSPALVVIPATVKSRAPARAGGWLSGVAVQGIQSPEGLGSCEPEAR